MAEETSRHLWSPCIRRTGSRSFMWDLFLRSWRLIWNGWWPIPTGYPRPLTFPKRTEPTESLPRNLCPVWTFSRASGAFCSGASAQRQSMCAWIPSLRRSTMVSFSPISTSSPAPADSLCNASCSLPVWWQVNNLKGI